MVMKGDMVSISAGELARHPQYTITPPEGVDACSLRSFLERTKEKELDVIGVFRLVYDPAGSMSVYFATDAGMNEKIAKIDEMVKSYVEGRTSK